MDDRLIGCAQFQNIAHPAVLRLAQQTLRQAQRPGRVADDPLGDGDRPVEQFRIGHDVRDQTIFLCLRCVKAVAGQEEFGGPRIAEDILKQPCAAVAGDDADLDEAAREFRAFGGDAEIRTLKSAEWVGGQVMPTGDALLSGYYLNELLLRLLARDDPHPALFDAWQSYIQALSGQLNDEQNKLLKNQIVGFAKVIAESAGGFLGFAKVSGKEEQVLARIGKAFDR